MKNPGLDAFAYIRSPNHPLNIDPLEDDPDLESGENDSDYMPPINFGRWRNPGQSIHVPLHQGPPFGPGESPEDAIHGEVISPAEQDGADRIIHGEHESDHPSANPYVAKAQQDLRTPGSDVSVDTLSGLLSGARPQSMGQDAMDAAHDWLSRRFSGVRVNPHHGTLVAASPAGMQMVKRQTHLPALPGQPAKPTSYTLTNKHGTFESPDSQRLIRSMIAFQIVHNELAQQRDKDDDDQSGGLTSTSGLFRGLRDAFREGYNPPASSIRVPAGAVFEPGNGTDRNHRDVQGGYVMDARNAPSNWHQDQHGTAYSPGHDMALMLDPRQATKPRPDQRFDGHTFTYAPNRTTGHVVPRQLGHIRYFVQNRVHPAARGAGFDHPSGPIPAPTRPTPREDPVSEQEQTWQTWTTEPQRTVPRSSPPQDPWGDESGEEPIVRFDDGPGQRRKGSVAQANDLCPVCASGYLEPYDNEHYECLNCGSLVAHIGFEKKSSKRPSRNRGGLGRGLADIMPYEGDPLNLASGGSENPENVDPDAPEDGYVHPLADEELPEDYEGYVAPRNRVQSSGQFSKAEHDQKLNTTAGEMDPIEEFVGKHGFQPIHRPGQPRAYLAPLVGVQGAYARLTEGVPTAAGEPSGWALTADHIPSNEYTKGGEPFRQRSIPLERNVGDGKKPSQFRQPLPDQQNRSVGNKTFLASGSHPIEDASLNRAIRDVGLRGRGSKPYWDALNQSSYEMPALPPETGTQRERRLLSSVGNPGLARFVA